MKKKQIERHLFGLRSFMIRHFDQEANLATLAQELANYDERSEDYLPGCIDTALAIGFVLGQIFEPGEPEINADIQAIKMVMRGKLPLLPREKKTGALPQK